MLQERPSFADLRAAHELPPPDRDFAPGRAREARAGASFQWRTQTPAEYAATYGAAMIGYTYDAYTYSDPGLESWLHELGELLRAQARRG